jgi:hypothetical protein
MPMNLSGRKLILAIAVSATICALAAQAQDLFSRNPPFGLHITDVRSIAPERHVGFSKTLELYSVTAYGQGMSYVLYCTKVAPESGKVYTALDDYVVSDLSALRLWPVERSTINLPAGASKKGRLYRVIIIEDIAAGNRPDLACDIYSEKAVQAAAR